MIHIQLARPASLSPRPDRLRCGSAPAKWSPARAQCEAHRSIGLSASSSPMLLSLLDASPPHKSVCTMPVDPFIAPVKVSDPGYIKEKFISRETAPIKQIFAKHWVPARAAWGELPVAILLCMAPMIKYRGVAIACPYLRSRDSCAQLRSTEVGRHGTQGHSWRQEAR